MAADPITATCQLLAGIPLVAFAAAGLYAAVRESPPARHRRRPRAAGLLGAAAAAGFMATGVLASIDRPFVAALVLAGALAGSGGGIWLARAPGTERDDGGGGAGRGPTPPVPRIPGDGIDWDAFARDFGAYASARDARTRTLV